MDVHNFVNYCEYSKWCMTQVHPIFLHLNCTLPLFKFLVMIFRHSMDMEPDALCSHGDATVIERPEDFLGHSLAPQFYSHGRLDKLEAAWRVGV